MAMGKRDRDQPRTVQWALLKGKQLACGIPLWAGVVAVELDMSFRQCCSPRCNASSTH